MSKGLEYKKRLLSNLTASCWKNVFSNEVNKPYFNSLCESLAKEEENGPIYPPIYHIFEAFNFTPLDKVKVVIIGQDPYHDDNQAHGLCFSVQPGIKIPPSLRNMYDELENDIDGFKRPSHGYLLSWAKQGILMLNATLTVKPHCANEHKNFGWQKFTDFVISYLNKETSNKVFALWGGFAKKKGKCIDRKKHYVIEAGHPSPLSVKYWKGCKTFSKINNALEEYNLETIDWHLPLKVSVEYPPGIDIESIKANTIFKDTDNNEESDDMDIDSDDMDIDYSSKTVVHLKQILREKSLLVSGTKAVLIERLKSSNKQTTLGKRNTLTDREETPTKKQCVVQVQEEKEEETEENKETDFSIPKKEVENDIKIVSWNVAGFNSVLKKGFEDYVKKEDPDVLCLQETKIEPSLVSKNLLSNYFRLFSIGKKKGYSGTAVFCKKEPISITKGIGNDEFDNEGRVITSEFDNFYLITSYIPNSGRGLVRLDYRLQWDKAFFKYLKNLEKIKPIIWCGDLNVAHKEIDLKNPKTNKKSAGFTKEERDSFSSFLNDGFVDIYRNFYPDETDCYTYWSYFRGSRGKNVGWRLDYFIVSESFVPTISKYFRRELVKGSDHCPIGIIVSNKAPPKSARK